MCDKFINKEDSSPIGLEAEKPILPVKVLSCFAELNPTTEPIEEPIKEEDKVI